MWILHKWRFFRIIKGLKGWLPSIPLSLLYNLYAKSVRIKMIGVTGHAGNKKQGQKVKYDKGATVAYNNLVKWMESKTPTGVSAPLKLSFSFDGRSAPYLKGDSRRIDIDVIKGEILKG